MKIVGRCNARKHGMILFFPFLQKILVSMTRDEKDENPLFGGSLFEE